MQNIGVRAMVDGLNAFTAGTAQMDRSMAATGKSADNLAVTSAAANRALLTLATAGAAAVTAALGASVMSAAAFEKAMAGIAAVSGASARDLTALSEAARTAGGRFGFMATDSAAGVEALIKAGVSVTDVLAGALPAALTLAAAGSVDVKDAAEIAANAMNQFSLRGSDMAHIADVVAGAANASAIDVRDFQLSLQQVGAVAATTGQTFDSTAEAIAVMGTAGIKSSDAGTSLKTMLMNLQPQGKQAKEVMEALGLITAKGANAFFDAEGKAKSFKDIAGTLQTALSGLTEQQKLATLSIVFGSDAARAAAVLAREGATGFDQMAAAMGKVSAEDVAGKRLDSLSGDLEKLRVKLDATAQDIGKEMIPALRGAAQAMGELVDQAVPLTTWIGTNLAEALQSASRWMVIMTYDAQVLWRALGDVLARQQGINSAGVREAQAAFGETGLSARQPFMKDWDIADVLSYNIAVGNSSVMTKEAAVATREWQAELDKSNADAAADKVARLNAALNGGGSGGVAGAAKEVKTAFEELGSGISLLRRAVDEGVISQTALDAAILAMGGAVTDTGPMVAGYGLTVRGLAAAFTSAGFDGRVMVDTILAQQAAVKAEAEAVKQAAKERQDALDREAAAAKARAMALAGIQGASARDLLGGIRGRGSDGQSGAQTGADLAAAVSGFERLTKAEMDTAVATEVMEARLARLSAMFGVLAGDDLASAGAVTDQARKLREAFAAGTIGTEEFIAGMQALTPELTRLGGEVDKIWEGWRRAEEEFVRQTAENARRVAQDTKNATNDMFAGINDALKASTTASQIYWQQQQDAIHAATAAVNEYIMGLMRSRDVVAGEEARQRELLLRGKALGIRDLMAAGGSQTDLDILLDQLRRVFGEVGTLMRLAELGLLPSAGFTFFGAGAGHVADVGFLHGGGPLPGMVSLPPGSSGGAVDRSVSIKMDAHYSVLQSEASVRYDLEKMGMLAGI